MNVLRYELFVLGQSTTPVDVIQWMAIIWIFCLIMVMWGELNELRRDTPKG